MTPRTDIDSTTIDTIARLLVAQIEQDLRADDRNEACVETAELSATPPSPGIV